MTRPASITASLSGTPLWSTGSYQYDGAGNIWKIGTSWYEYDSLSRLKTGSVSTGTTVGGTLQTQTYSFDDYGNLQLITTQIGAGTPTVRNTPTSTSTNRLTGSVGYDAAGNLTYWNGAVYEYDGFDQMVHMTNGTENWAYIYTADDERIWSYNLGANFSHWTLRDLGGKVLRDFLNNAGWSVAEDYIYRDGLLLAGYLGNGQRRHFSLDHLGTVRLVTNTAGTQTDYHVYYPFGEEATAFDPNADRMQFTGHERDVNSQSGASPSADDLDYMHARFFNPLPGRFLSADRAPTIAAARRRPQLWNRYSYVLGNPGTYVDLNGLEVVVPDWMQPAVQAGLKKSTEFRRLYERLDKDHRVRATFGRSAKPLPGARYSQEQHFLRSKGVIDKLDITIVVPVGKQGDTALVAHEFKHDEEILDTNKTLEERYRGGDPNVRQVGNRTYESQDALDTEKIVRDQMESIIIPPGAVELDLNRDLFSVGSFILEGIYVQLAPR